jgi:hypothetical protein
MYDRQLLLCSAKRDAVLALWEVERYGRDSYGDDDYVSIYGMRPREWYAKGLRLLGRTAVECTRDVLADSIGNDVAALTASAPASPRAVIVDPFVGSGNTLHWLLRHQPGARAVGFELDPGVFELTRRNLLAVASPIEVANTDYRSGLANTSLTDQELLIVFIAPPWGDALQGSMLDLRGTSPPITEIVSFVRRACARNRILCAVQIYETAEPDSMQELRALFDWSALRVYGLNAPGQNHGIVVGTIGWVPAPPPQGPEVDWSI